MAKIRTYRGNRGFFTLRRKVFTGKNIYRRAANGPVNDGQHLENQNSLFNNAFVENQSLGYRNDEDNNGQFFFLSSSYNDQNFFTPMGNRPMNVENNIDVGGSDGVDDCGNKIHEARWQQIVQSNREVGTAGNEESVFVTSSQP
jgi:hypothetical protein